MHHELVPWSKITAIIVINISIFIWCEQFYSSRHRPISDSLYIVVSKFDTFWLRKRILNNFSWWIWLSRTIPVPHLRWHFSVNFLSATLQLPMTPSEALKSIPIALYPTRLPSLSRRCLCWYVLMRRLERTRDGYIWHFTEVRRLIEHL